METPHETPPAAITGNQTVTNVKTALAKEFRKKPTAKEAEVWEWLRSRRLLGLKWRRQQVIAGFIADFYCAELRLALEIDGGVHHTDEARAYDKYRDSVFRRKSIVTLRLSNDECTKATLRMTIEEYLATRR